MPFAAGPSASDLGGLAGWVLDVIDTLGAVGVAALVALENVFPPIPSEVVLPLAGFLAGAGRLSLLAVIVAATIGSLVGAVTLYWAGAALGRSRLDRIAARMPLMEPDDIDKSSGWFDRHGRTAVLVGRLVPGVRSLISIPAGVARMPLGWFLLYTALGSAAFNTALIVLGHQLGSRWKSIGQYSDPINYTVYAVLGLLLAFAVTRRVRSRRQRADA